jgi:general stress protein 26
MESKQKKLNELLHGFRDAMLVTRADDGAIHGRPMSLAEIEGDSDVWFATQIESPKVNEIKRDAHVAVTLQDGHGRYVSLSGQAEMVRDSATIDKLWTEAWKVWFPEGKSDPSLCLIKVRAARGEFWDMGGTNKVRYLFEAARAYVTGTEPKSPEGTHGSVKLSH